MKTLCFWVGCLLLVASLAWAQNEGAVGAAPAPVVTAPAAGAVDPGKAAAPLATGKNAVGSARGYLKTTPEAEALWKQLGQAESDLRQKQWELYVLLNADTRDKAAVRTKFAEVRALMTQVKTTRDGLKASWIPLDAKEFGGAKGGHARKGNGVKAGANKNKNLQQAPATAPAVAPATAPAAPAPAN